ncbi:MAG: hypothetical protein IPH72_15890 [Sandaracinaceae bacterium]|nr:hypothetical protein [Sandaracinaceae bacterium]
MLNQPGIVEALYKNRNMRMSTADRLVELCARNGAELTASPASPSTWPPSRASSSPSPRTSRCLATHLPGGARRRTPTTLDAIVREVNPVLGRAGREGRRQVRRSASRSGLATKSEKLRLAVIGDAAARALLVRDTNKGIAMAAMSSPKMTEKEATNIACSREVGADVLRHLGTRRKWLQSYELKMALIFNPKTPVGISMAFIAHLRLNDLRTLAKSRSVAQPLKTLARQRVEMLEKAGRG